MTRIPLVFETEGNDCFVTFGIRQNRERNRKFVHDRRVLHWGIGTQSVDTGATVEELMLAKSHNGQLAVTVSSEVTAMKRDDHR